MDALCVIIAAEGDTSRTLNKDREVIFFSSSPYLKMSLSELSIENLSTCFISWDIVMLTPSLASANNAGMTARIKMNRMILFLINQLQ